MATELISVDVAGHCPACGLAIQLGLKKEFGRRIAIDPVPNSAGNVVFEGKIYRLHAETCPAKEALNEADDVDVPVPDSAPKSRVEREP